MTHYGVLYPDGKCSGSITTSQRDAAHYAKQHRGSVYEAGGKDDPAKRLPRVAPWYPDETEDFRPPAPDPDARTREDDRLDDPRHGQAAMINHSIFGSR